MLAIDQLTNFISYVQRRKIFTRERCKNSGRLFFLITGLFVLLYSLISFFDFVFLFCRSTLGIFLDFTSKFFVFTSRMISPKFSFVSSIIVGSSVAFFLTKLSSKCLESFSDKFAAKFLPMIDQKKIRRFFFVFLWIFLLISETFLLSSFNFDSVSNQQSNRNLKTTRKNESPLKDKPQASIKSSNTGNDLINQGDSINGSNHHQFGNRSLFGHSSKSDKIKSRNLTTKYFLGPKFTETSSLYVAYTDPRCFNPERRLNRDRSSTKKHGNYLNSYRLYSPFAIYVSVLRTNGGKCYEYYPNSSCAISSKSIYFTRLGRFVFGSLLIILLLILALLAQKRYMSTNGKNHHESVSTNPVDDKIRTTIDDQVAENLRQCFSREQNNGYQNITETCRQTLNQYLSQADENITIETIQFSNAALDQLEQDKGEPTPKTLIIHGKFSLDHLIITIVNKTRQERFSLQAAHYVVQIQVELIIDDDQYRIRVKFNKIYSDGLKLIDENNILSNNEKQSIIKLVEETICQSIVPCHFHLTDDRQNNSAESPSAEEFCARRSVDYRNEDQASMSTISNRVPQSPIDSRSISTQQSELTIQCQPDFPISDPIMKATVKTLSVHIVKAVKLRKVEQPYCVLELNSPKQIHLTSIAKDGSNPVWDERFIFECDDHTNQLRLQLFDRCRPSKKDKTLQIDRLLVDLYIPFAYVTSNRFEQEIRLTPQFPEAIIFIEFSSRSDNESIDKLPDRQSLSDGIISLSSEQKLFEKNNRFDSAMIFPLSPTNTDESTNLISPKKKKKKSIFSSLKSCKSPKETPFDTEEILKSDRESRSFARRIQNLFRTRSKSKSKSKLKKKNKTINSGNFILDQSDLISTSTPNSKKRFFSRSKQKKQSNGNISANSLNSDDFSRSVSTRNTPIRANVGRPVTMIKSNQ